MAVTNSPNMSLPIPGVGTQPGPDFAFNVNQALTLLDQHDHSPGKGIQITPAGLNINDDLSFQGHDLTNANALVFAAQGSPDSTLLSLYVAPGLESPTPINDLWFTDGVGNQIQITSNGLVNATIASLPGESYAFGTFTWVQIAPDLAGAPANFDIGSITLRPNIVATAYGVTLNASNIISSYNWVFPAALPIPTNNFLTLTSTGGLGYVDTTGGIITSMIADGAVTRPKLAAGLGTLTSQTFSSSGSFTVPAGVTEMFAKLTAAGGGGGGGGKSSSGGGGGAGGQGSAPVITAFSVAPGDVLTITLGAGGTAGVGATAVAPATGGNGGNGGVAEIVKNGTTTVCLVAGGAGGAGGGGSGTPPLGGVGAASLYAANSFTSAGGSGGNGQTAGGLSGSAGGNSFTGTGGTGGAGGLAGAGGGGGGGAGFGNGANGGASNTAGSNASNTAAGGGGGGGGLNGGSGTTNGKNGGTGASGSITLYWIP